MKRIIALCLTIVMLLGMVSMVASANEVEYFTGVSLALRESIAISFKADEAAIASTFTKVEFLKNGNVVQTIEDLPEANDEGKVAFACTKIAPSEMGTDITAKLYLGETVADELTASVYDYCDAVLADANADATLKTLVVDMLNYGAATQTYINDNNAKVNAELTPEQAALGTAADAELPLENITDLGADPEGASVTWTAAALSLRESVAISYKFTAASVEGLSVALACGESEWTVNSFTEEDDGVYSFRFTGLNPAMMRDAVTAVVMNGETAVSPELTYSIESYAAQVVADANASAELVALVKAMMRYGDAAAAYVAGTPAHVYDDNGRCVVCTTAHFTAGKNVYIEAEDIDLNSVQDPNNNSNIGNSVTGNANASGGTIVRLLGYNRTLPTADQFAHMSFEVTPEETGTYYIWIKAYVGNNACLFADIEGVNDTYVERSIGGNTYSTTYDGKQGATTSDFVWVCMPVDTNNTTQECQWTGGETYEVRIRAKDIAIWIDQFVVTSDANFNPGTHAHTIGTEYGYNSAGHGLMADCCYGVISDMTAHTYEHGKCVCGYELFSQVIEAEDVNLNSVQDPNNNSNIGNSVTSNANASGGKIVRLLGYNRTLPTADQFAHMSFEVTPEKAGTYYIWIKAYVGKDACLFADIEGVNDTYVERSIGGNTYSTTYDGKQGATTSDFVWVCMPVDTNNTTQECQWTGGETYEVRIRARDIAIWIDQFLITNDANFDPATHTHTFGADYGFDGDGHWQKADCCDGVKGEVTEHTFVNGKCICGYELFKQVIEAEDVNLNSVQDPNNNNNIGNSVTSNANASGGKIVRLLGYNNALPTADQFAHMSFEVTPEETGTYYIWIKAYVGENAYLFADIEGVNDTYVQRLIGGNTYSTTYNGGQGGTTSDFVWVCMPVTTNNVPQECQWTGGETYEVRIRARDIAIWIDQFVVTNDASFNPTFVPPTTG